MRHVIFMLCLLLASPALATWDEWEDQPDLVPEGTPNVILDLIQSRLHDRLEHPRARRPHTRRLTPVPQPGLPLLGPITENAYGLGLHSDSTGRPFRWVTPDGQTSPFLRVEPNAYGLGVGKDQFGRPVRPQ